MMCISIVVLIIEYTKMHVLLIFSINLHNLNCFISTKILTILTKREREYVDLMVNTNNVVLKHSWYVLSQFMKDSISKIRVNQTFLSLINFIESINIYNIK